MGIAGKRIKFALRIRKIETFFSRYLRLPFYNFEPGRRHYCRNGPAGRQFAGTITVLERALAMKRLLLATQRATAALAIALFITVGPAGAEEPRGKGKGGAARNTGPNPGSNKSFTPKTGNGAKTNTGGGLNPVTKSGNEKVKTDLAKPGNTKPATGTVGKAHHNGPGKKDWKNWSKEGWTQNGWNNQYNTQHQNHHHGYWNNGIWVFPLILVGAQPWAYMQPTWRVVPGQKWFGVTFEPYDGGGAYITGVYQGSPAARSGIEPGDVIVTLDGRDATNLSSAIQSSGNIALVQVLSGHTGELLETQVNMIP